MINTGRYTYYQPVGNLLSDVIEVTVCRPRVISAEESPKEWRGELALGFLLLVPGEYEYTLRDSKGRTIISDRGSFQGDGKQDLKDFICDIPLDRGVIRYMLEATYTLYQYVVTEPLFLGRKFLIESDDKGPLAIERQKFTYHIIVENVSGDVRVRVEE